MPLANKPLSLAQKVEKNASLKTRDHMGSLAFPELGRLPESAYVRGELSAQTSEPKLTKNLNFVSIKTKINYVVNSRPSATWMYQGVSSNKLAHMLNGNRSRSYNIGMWNCRKGLTNSENLPTEKIVDVKEFLESNDLQLLCLIEADLHGATSRVRRVKPLTGKEIEKNLKIENYKIILPQSWQHHGQARVLLYVRDDINLKVKPLARGDTDLPSVSCEIGVGREKKTRVNFFYREWTSGVSGLGDINSQTERLKRQIEHWKTLHTGGRDTIILGDANLCALKWEDENFQHKDLALQVQEYLLETSSYQMVKEPTRVGTIAGDGISSSCIDHCYTNVPEKIKRVQVVGVGNSDHLGVIIQKFTKFPVSKPQTVKKRNYKEFDVESFLTDIYNSDINTIVTGAKTIDTAAEAFENIFKSVLNTHAPMKVFQMRKNYNPFVSEETRELILNRKALQEEAAKTKCKILMREFNYQCKEVKKAIAKDEKEFFENGFDDKMDSAKAWRTANELLGTVKNLSPTAIVHQEEGEDSPELINNPLKMATIFNKFFRQKITNLRQKTATEATIAPTTRLRNWLNKRADPPPQFRIKKIGLVTLRKAVKKMKGKRVHGRDEIDSYSLKLAAPLMEESLLHLVNLSIESQNFAKPWKPQLILPFHKKNEKTKVENYRPVSHLVEVGKMVEYIAGEQILEHFITNDLFHPNHHGSLANHSTATALIQLTDMWMEASEKKELTGVCMIDQSAAYDLLSHEIFAEKLKLYNFDEASVNWCMSYLGGRTQCVQVESKMSDYLECEDSGAPQGSILAGLFHVIHSNDLPDCHEEGESVVYVDDDTDSVHSGDPEQLVEKLQREVNNTVSWLKDNRLCVAGDKSKLLVVGTPELRTARLTDQLAIEVDGQQVAETGSEKLLGLVVNNRLSWKEHLHGDQENPGLISQLKQRVGTLRRLSKYMSKERLKMMVSGIFYSKLMYCLPVYGNVHGLASYRDTRGRSSGMTVNDCNQLQVLQNSVNRLITGARYGVATTELLNSTNSLSVQQMVAYYTLIMVHKITITGKPAYLAGRLRLRREDERELRGWGGRTVEIPDYSLETSRAGFVYRGGRLYNSLSRSLREEMSISMFKKGVKMWVKDKIPVKPGS